MQSDADPRHGRKRAFCRRQILFKYTVVASQLPIGVGNWPAPYITLLTEILPFSEIVIRFKLLRLELSATFIAALPAAATDMG